MKGTKKGTFCPLIKKDCVEEKCVWYVHIRGNNPNTGEEVDECGCAVAWMPVLAIEVAQKTNQAGAAVESFRNEVVQSNKENQQLLIHSIQHEISHARINPVINPMQLGGQQ